MFDLSLLKVLDDRPWRWTDATESAKQTLNGVFVLLSDELVDELRATMTAAEKAEVAPWVTRMTIDEPDPIKRPETWHVPVWAGQNRAVYWRIPQALWASPTDPVPAKVKRYLARLFREDEPE